MKQNEIKIENIPDDLMELIKEKAKENNLTPSVFVKKILQEEMIISEVLAKTLEVKNAVETACHILDENTTFLKTLLNKEIYDE